MGHNILYRCPIFTILADLESWDTQLLINIYTTKNFDRNNKLQTGEVAQVNNAQVPIETILKALLAPWSRELP